ncbi:aminopeptidase N-like [Pogonomyrmex barbatus]|uniref:Aminopeptidase N-like n=1 Tax=Pogonomyrmex barbatus TaxID=144034 RepID=A0A8N1S2Q7_9HYME|nr:aminopeptidase N-like [Pogonomyrmex barbatus]
MFPSWDEPALKATFNISVKHHQKYKVLSNMPLRDQYTDEDGMMWAHFNITPIMSTYLVAIVLSEYDGVSNADETVNMWCKSSMTSQIKFAHSFAEKFEQILIRYTNISRQVPKMDHVTIPSFLVNGMENWGLILYNERTFMYNSSTDPTLQRKHIASLVAHELAHQWFGNLVTPSWWSHLWLSEGFAVFLETYLLDKMFDWRIMDLFVLEKLHICFELDTGFYMDSVVLENNLRTELFFSYEVYFKAPVILRMLQHIVTDDVFQYGIILYLDTHKFRSATSDDLWIALQDALDKSEVPHNNYKIKEVMDTWIKQKTYPLVNVTRNYTTGEVIISQRSSYNLEETDVDSIKWWIPVTFATQTNPDFSNTSPRYWLKPQDQNISFQIDTNDWIIVNLQQTGYYRVNYDYTNWQRIVRYLNSEEYTKIHVLNRAQIIYDVFIYLVKDQLDASIFINITNYLSRETDYVAWYSIFEILSLLSQYFMMPEIEAFKLHMVGILNELLQNTGYEENPKDDDIVKSEKARSHEMGLSP